MKLILAPMEGLVDVHIRTLLTRSGGFDHCVTEFLRVVDRLLPPRVFHRICPEAKNGWKTPSGTPVHLQLLGSHPQAMADNACLGAELGAPVIDVNFGCPSKIVNNNKGGAVLLKEPETIYHILSTIRSALPAHVPLTAKMRLGFDDKSLAIDNALAMQSAGAVEVCVHARTKVEGYKPPAHWEWIAKIKEQLSINVVANGDVCSLEDYKTCIDVSGCQDVMIGRGAVARPDLARSIKDRGAPLDDWYDIIDLLLELLDLTRNEGSPKYSTSRIKQWMSFLREPYPEAGYLFEQLKKLMTADEVELLLRQARQMAA